MKPDIGLTMSDRDRSWLGKCRDAVAYHLFCFALFNIATPYYRDFMGAAVRHGMPEAWKDYVDERIALIEINLAEEATDDR